ncbi:esterase/lipase family protein [Anaeromicrobium sediminis]|uniref:esterase/lipase family protein n=1 Tax=Anaeromicrobium sediminis TaxID=1478221 RepID=UPI001A9A2FC2|nr:hypothetical protein [Anaeromicrobium sediminis]
MYKKIKEAKKITGCHKVNLIGHSMGELVSRSYVQSDYYANDVEQLIQLGTPNSGTAPNFSFWSGGELPDQDNLGFNFVRMYMDAYMLILKIKYKGQQIDAIHTHFKGLNNIIPALTYGDYLFYEDNNMMEFKSIQGMQTQNSFLNNLNKNMNIIK